MADDMVVGQKAAAAAVLSEKDFARFANNSSDAAGFAQLLFHAGCALTCGLCVHFALSLESWAPLVFAELALGFVSSFYFMGYHELIHATAFKTKWINQVLAHVVGFGIFRGATWFWCFHWLHHRYAQDASRDPELSGGSADLMDPTVSVANYLRFLTGWPFGFERIKGMFDMARGARTDAWVEEAGLEQKVRIESGVYFAGYAFLAVLAVVEPGVGAALWWYWLLPHILGAGHLRFYQFAEHRACENGPYTQIDAFGGARTTQTWWLYRKLAWNMPFHVEHHAFPAVPFHLLGDVHEAIKAKQPESRCLISGEGGYFALHAEFVRRLAAGEPTALAPLAHAPSAQPATADRPPWADKQLPIVALEEVQKHATREDCWVVINGYVIDATTFLPTHPGGAVVLAGKAGTDASKVFRMIHPKGALNILPGHCVIGRLPGADPEPLLA